MFCTARLSGHSAALNKHLLLRFAAQGIKKRRNHKRLRRFVVTSGGFEPPAYRLGGGRSIQLSYEVR